MPSTKSLALPTAATWARALVKFDSIVNCIWCELACSTLLENVIVRVPPLSAMVGCDAKLSATNVILTEPLSAVSGIVTLRIKSVVTYEPSGGKRTVGVSVKVS